MNRSLTRPVVSHPASHSYAVVVLCYSGCPSPAAHRHCDHHTDCCHGEGRLSPSCPSPSSFTSSARPWTSNTPSLLLKAHMQPWLDLTVWALPFHGTMARKAWPRIPLAAALCQGGAGIIWMVSAHCILGCIRVLLASSDTWLEQQAAKPVVGGEGHCSSLQDSPSAPTGYTEAGRGSTMTYVRSHEVKGPLAHSPPLPALGWEEQSQSQEGWEHE